MYREYFPPCEVEGSVEPPVAFTHMGSVGAVPNKCVTCEHLFEGSCTRAAEELNKFLHLDHGSCKVKGATNPVFYEDDYIKSKVEVPEKCVSCSFLKMETFRGFYCSINGVVFIED